MSLDFLLMEEEKSYKLELQEFFTHQIQPLAEKIEDSEDRDALGKAVALTGERGYLAGGLDPQGLVRQTLVHECASYVSYALETTIASSLSCALPLKKHGTDEIRDRYSSDLVRGKTLGAIAVTEGDVGSDVSAMKTTIEIDDETCTISGFKRYISNAGEADLYIIYGISRGDVPAHQGMSAVVVPGDTPGLTVPRTYHFMGRRGSVVGEVSLSQVQVPRSHLLGEPHQGFRIMLGMFNFERILLGGSGLGLARRAFELARDHSSRRRVFGQKLGEKQLIWNKIAQMRTRIDSAELLVYRAARRYDRGATGKELMGDAAMAKLVGTETSNFCADQAVQILGGDGLTREYGPVEQLYRDARAQPIVGGTNEMMSYLIAKRELPELDLNL